MTHGNERIGLKVAEEIKKLQISSEILAVQIANKKALDANKRYIDQDLNRSFPGKKSGNHEQELAYALLPNIKSADLVIDIHSTTSRLKDAIIVTKLDKRTRECIGVIQPKYVLLMNATKRNALISAAKVGIAFEYGKDKDIVTLKKTVLGIKKLLAHLKIIHAKFPQERISITYFNVISTVARPEGYKLLGGIKNYVLIKKGQSYARRGRKLLIAGKGFYPILFGEKTYKNIFGFMGTKMGS